MFLKLSLPRNSLFSVGKECNNFPFLQVNCEESRAERIGACLPNIIPNYTIHLYPSVILHNLLPYDIQFMLEVQNSSPKFSELTIFCLFGFFFCIPIDEQFFSLPFWPQAFEFNWNPRVRQCTCDWCLFRAAELTANCVVGNPRQFTVSTWMNLQSWRSRWRDWSLECLMNSLLGLIWFKGRTTFVPPPPTHGKGSWEKNCPSPVSRKHNFALFLWKISDGIVPTGAQLVFSANNYLQLNRTVNWALLWWWKTRGGRNAFSLLSQN